MKETCYFCDKQKTSDEHAPPRCIFPEQKDTGGKDYRKNLITVPSCDAHNTNKCKDDEYLMMVLAAHYKNNQVAKNQTATKLFRSWKLNPEFAKKVVKNPRSIVIDGNVQVAFEIDNERFYRTLECIAHALYFYNYNHRIRHAFKLIAVPLLSTSKDAQLVNAVRSKILIDTNILFDKIARLGENQEVFWYQLASEPEDRTVMRMCFYQGFQAVLMASPDLEI